MTAHKSLQFEGFTLDLDRLCVHGPFGQANLRRKSFEVLRYLAGHAGRVVTKEELMGAVWPDVTVGDESLTQCVSEIRRALGAKGQSIIKTVARRGYLMDVPILATGIAAQAAGSERYGQSKPISPFEQPSSASHQAPLASSPGPPTSTPSQAVEPGRRQVTVVACGFGAAALSGQVDPEDLHEILAEYHRCAREAAEAHGGYLSKSLGDGALYVFGYPHAGEDDAERAVRAGLAMTRIVGGFTSERSAEPLQVRVGIATGVVVAGDMGEEVHADQVIIGEAPLLASFLLGLAGPNAVVISPSTRRLIGSLFDYRDLGAVQINQLPNPIEVSEVLRESAIGSRLEALRSVARDLVGREEELSLLLRRWHQAKAGKGCVVLLTGEAGIGKSKLAHTFQERVAGDEHIPLIFHCSPHHQDSALHPIIGQMLEAADIERDETAAAKLEKLEALLRQGSQDLAAEMSIFSALLSIPGGHRYPPPDLTPQHLKARTLGAILTRLEQLAARKPLLMVFEDLHWVDPTSLDVLSSLVDQAPGLQLLLIATFRPEFSPPWASHRHVTTVLLNRLGRDEGKALVTAVAGGKAVPPDLVAQILDRTDGVPLFIEELSKSVFESGSLRVAGDRYELNGSLTELAVPFTLHASLLARLDRLASVKEVAQIGAAIGREFSYRLVAAVSPLSEADLQAALAQLVGAELVFQRGSPPDATYVFKHALVQEAAYASVLRGRRHRRHGDIARALEKHCPEIVAAEPEMAAHHYTQAGDLEAAKKYWRRAGERFLARSAYVESIKHLTKAIEMLKSMPETTEGLGEELETLMKMVPALIAVGGAGSTELEVLYLRARELVDRLERTSLRFPVLWGLWYLNQHRGRYSAALEAGDDLLAAARAAGDTGQILEAHHALWALLSVMGNTVDAIHHMDCGVALYDRQLHASQAFLYAGHDVGTCSHYHLAKDLWLLGHHDRSKAALDRALRMADELKHPMTTAIALWFIAWVHYQRGDRAALKEVAERLIVLATERGHWLADITPVLLMTDARPNRQELAELHGMLQVSTRAPSAHRAFCLCVLAAMLGAGGHVDDGLAALGSIRPEDREGYYAPEIYRLEGELRRQFSSPQLDQVERCFHESLVLARQRSVKSLELRAAMSLACLRRDHGRPGEAHGILKPVYDWFTEGLDLPDLRQARSMLDDLGRST